MDINFICLPENVPQFRTVLSPEDKLGVFSRMLAKATQYKLPRGTFAVVATELSVDRRVVAGVCRDGLQQLRDGRSPSFPSKKSFCSRKAAVDSADVRAAIKAVPLEDQMCMLSIATKAGLTV